MDVRPLTKSFCLCFLMVIFSFFSYKIKAFALERIVGTATARVVTPSQIGTSVDEPIFKFRVDGYKVITNPNTQINYETSGYDNSFINAELSDLDGKRMVRIANEDKILPIELKNENGDSVKAEIIFFDDVFILNKNGEAKFKTILKIKRYVGRPNKKAIGTFKAGYYVRIQH